MLIINIIIISNNNKYINMLLNKPIIIDGAMGTELISRGIPTPLPLWSAIANTSHNKIISDIHSDYIKAGSNVITTNTFRTTIRSYLKAGYNIKDAHLLSKQSFTNAIKAAKKATLNNNTLIALSIAPLEDCYEPDLFPGSHIALSEYKTILQMINKDDVDIILFETMGCYKEIKSALIVSSKIKTMKWLSIILKDSNSILDGTSIEKVMDLALEHDVDALLVNCSPLIIISKSIDKIINKWVGKWGVYPNVGLSMPTKDGYFKKTVDNHLFLKEVSMYIDKGASIIGACCGSNPELISMISKHVDRY